MDGGAVKSPPFSSDRHLRAVESDYVMLPSGKGGSGWDTERVAEVVSESQEFPRGAPPHAHSQVAAPRHATHWPAAAAAAAAFDPATNLNLISLRFINRIPV